MEWTVARCDCIDECRSQSLRYHEKQLNCTVPLRETTDRRSGSPRLSRCCKFKWWWYDGFNGLAVIKGTCDRTYLYIDWRVCLLILNMKVYHRFSKNMLLKRFRFNEVYTENESRINCYYNREVNSHVNIHRKQWRVKKVRLNV